MKIDLNKTARKVEVDNRIPLRYYYRIADNLLRQASVYREERNVVDLYIMLLRFSSLISETIPFHRDYQGFHLKEKASYRKRLLSVLEELESLKPEFNRRVEELNRGYSSVQIRELDGVEDVTYGSGSSYPQRTSVNRNAHPERSNLQVQYPTHSDLASIQDASLEQAGLYEGVATKNNESEGLGAVMDSVLSLDDGKWIHPTEEPGNTLVREGRDDPFQFVGIRQPSPPPVLAQVQHEYAHIPPSKVADPRPGPAPCQDGMSDSNSFQDVHVPVNMMDDFLRLARANTEKNLETCGVLAGALKNRVFHISMLIIPKQESTSDSCQTLNEEEIFEVQDKLSLFPLGWIHTHPTQTCFMSSVDLHTHYSYQIMLPEAIAIVMAPTDESSPHGIFHLSDPGGVSVIRNCQQRGFHPHEEPVDGNPIYEHCSHVYLNAKMKFEVVDLR
ncbi:AMSH-like ubiquitin thioesterase 3 [Linum perenne]